MKSNTDKKINSMVKKLNKSLRADVFGNRFDVRQVSKSTADGVRFYIYKLIDNEQPQRNYETNYLTSGEILNLHKLHIEINDFIVYSDFWQKHKESGVATEAN